MTRLPRLGVPDLTAVCQNGRSPACWQRQVHRAAKRHEALAQTCAWVDDMVRQPAPKLQPGPLLGGCLAELVADAPPAEAGQATEGASGSHSPARAADTARSAAKRKPFAPPTPARRETPPLPQGVRARPEALQRWAGKTAVSHARRPSTPRRLRPAASAWQRAPLPTNDRSAPVAWTDELVRRARQQFAPPATAVSPHQVDEPVEDYAARRRAAGSPPPEAMPAGLPAQWRQSLTGLAAPPDLLQRLCSDPAPATEAATAARPARPTAVAPEPLSEKGGAAAAAAANRSNQRAEGVYSPGQSPAAGPDFVPLPPELHERPSVAPAKQGHTAVSESAPTPDAADDGWFTAPRFAPPQLAEVMPRLRPLPKPGSVSLSPIAASAAERSARREAEAMPEDLDTLARKLKQILDEESRRHGIDV